jgi:REP element-mobilizing transposase RayT
VSPRQYVKPLHRADYTFACVFVMHAYLVLVTKYRGGVFTKAILEELRGIFSRVCIDFEARQWSSTGRTTMCTCW